MATVQVTENNFEATVKQSRAANAGGVWCADGSIVASAVARRTPVAACTSSRSWATCPPLSGVGAGKRGHNRQAGRTRAVFVRVSGPCSVGDGRIAVGPAQAEPLLRFRLQRGGRADRGRRAVSIVRAPAVADVRGGIDARARKACACSSARSQALHPVQAADACCGGIRLAPPMQSHGRSRSRLLL